MILTELLGDNVNVYGQYGDHKVIVKVSPYDVPETVSTLRVAMLTPLVMNIYYFCDPDGKSAYVQDENAVPVDDRTPYLGRFCFRDMICTDCAVATGFFYGLPERSIEEIEISNVTFTFRKNAKKGHPTMMFDAGDSCETLIGSVGWRGHRGLCVRFQGIGFNGLLCCFAPPSSVSSYPMTSAYGGVGVLAGEIVTFATIISLVTMLFWVYGVQLLDIYKSI